MGLEKKMLLWFRWAQPSKPLLFVKWATAWCNYGLPYARDNNANHQGYCSHFYNVEYFSDGCVEQYKDNKSFYNLCMKLMSNEAGCDTSRMASRKDLCRHPFSISD